MYKHYLKNEFSIYYNILKFELCNELYNREKHLILEQFNYGLVCKQSEIAKWFTVSISMYAGFSYFDRSDLALALGPFWH